MSGICQFDTWAIAARCIVFAVLRLMTSSYLEACSTGRSAGLVPTHRSPNDFVQSRCWDHHPNGVVSLSGRGIVPEQERQGRNPACADVHAQLPSAAGRPIVTATSELHENEGTVAPARRHWRER
jgi:hypothetical protein